METLSQYGGSPNGCTAARYHLQLLIHLLPTYAHTPSDIVNAHGDISRHAIRSALVHLVSLPDASELDREVLRYFDLYYTVPGVPPYTSTAV
jgi:hypothetical protein